MNNEFIGGVVGTSVCGVAVSTATTELQSVVSIICTIVGLLITIATTIVIPLIKKIIKAKEDGKVTIEEVEDIVTTAKDGIDKLGGKE